MTTEQQAEHANLTRWSAAAFKAAQEAPTPHKTAHHLASYRYFWRKADALLNEKP